MDVHKDTISIAVLNSSGKLVIECVIETKASTILQFFQGLSGSLQVTFEEGTWAAWLYDLLQPHVTKMVVCNPRRNALLKEGSKSDRIDARKLAELLRSNLIRPVYHGEHGLRTLKELGRSYLTISKDLGRVMRRPSTEAGVRRRAEFWLYFSSLAYVLVEALRRVGLAKTEWAESQVETIRLRLLKIAAQVRITERKIWIRYSKAYPWKNAFVSAWAALRC